MSEQLKIADWVFSVLNPDPGVQFTSDEMVPYSELFRMQGTGRRQIVCKEKAHGFGNHSLAVPQRVLLGNASQQRDRSMTTPKPHVTGPTPQLRERQRKTSTLWRLERVNTGKTLTGPTD
ncbi:hypothetical protein DPEC_G00267800 [Dallia pectoralis]|uniref:Uncharacterized protein n=1 Tax=Dallia pectoralis TaxID=75939 RepID=A0ACC2FP33_DALPE|nr:hypothetical protein DPEC_G00267800 [Dallia pectoralis]